MFFTSYIRSAYHSHLDLSKERFSSIIMKSRSFLLPLVALVGSLSGFKIDYRLPERAKIGKAAQTPPFESMTTTEIIQTLGYPAEIHHVTTEDGYILELHRIPYGRNGPSPSGWRRPVAFLQHCLLGSSADWVMDKPDRSLGYLLADAGYDVWMNNVRGNTYSRKHVFLDPDKDKKKFWEFTWDQMAIYDVPAAIDYVLEVTGNEQVYYVGFSMGTTVFFALMSEMPQYAAKIKVSALMGPVAYTEHVKGALAVLCPYAERLDLAMSLTGRYEFLPSNDFMHNLAENYCALEDKTAPICYNIIFLISGFDPDELNKEYMPAFLSNIPAGTSFHTVNHYAQLIESADFRKYDWGHRGNQKHYGQDEPPLYHLDEDTPPIGLFWGRNDWLATPKDTARIASEMKNVVVNHEVEWPKWNHLDFIWGIHAKEYVYDYVLEFLDQY